MILSLNQIVYLQVDTSWGPRVYTSRVKDVRENELVVFAPLEGVQPVLFELDSQITVAFNNTGQSVLSRYQAYGVIKNQDTLNDEPVLNILLESKWEPVEKRDFVRVNVLLSGTYSMIDDGRPTTAKGKDVIIKDLSGGGFLFSHEKFLEEDTVLMFTIKLPNNDFIHSHGKITRVKPLNETYEYGVSFINLSEKNRKKIIRFVYRKQIDIRKQMQRKP